VNLMPLSEGPGAPAWTRPPGHVRHALALSTVAHVAALGVLMWIGHARAVRPSQEAAQRANPQRIIWVPIPGQNGGGGGRQAPAPPRPRPEPRKAARTRDVPAPAPVLIAPEKTPLQETAEPQPPVLVNMADTAMTGAANAPIVTGGGSGPGLDRGTGEGAGPCTDRGFWRRGLSTRQWSHAARPGASRVAAVHGGSDARTCAGDHHRRMCR
jgi:hypothetical protein